MSIAEIPAVPTPGEDQLFLTRYFDAPVERLWELWTEPAGLVGWFGPHEITVDPASVVIELYPGGRWDLDMVDPGSGEHYPVRSILTEVVAPEYFEGEERADSGSDAGELELRLQVWFAPEGDGSVVTMVQGPFTAEFKELTSAGWLESFEKLDALLVP